MSYDVDWPNAEYHQVLPGLYMGGHVWQERGVNKHSADSSVSEDPSWDYVISAYADDARQCLPQCDMRYVLFADTEDGLSDEVWARIRSAVNEIVWNWREGSKVLIRCQAGYNRSGLLMCLVLMQLGFSAEKAIAHARWRRGRHVLVNRVFEQYVRDREDEYYMPDSWDETELIMNLSVPVKEEVAEEV